jgi:hypothetical protein
MKTAVFLEYPLRTSLVGFPPVHGKAFDASGIWSLRVLGQPV